MVKVKCILGYYDTKLNRSVAVDEEFEVSEDRAKQLLKAKVVENAAEPVKATRKPRTKKEA